MKKEILSRFKEKPRTSTAWWAMGLGMCVFFSGPILGTFAAVVQPFIRRVAGESVGIAAGFFVAISLLALTVAALVTSIRAYRKGERSWVMWVGSVPSVIAAAFWVFMIVGELVVPH